MELLRIGCAAGFSGDRTDAAAPVVEALVAAGGPAVLIFETLAERTLALAQLARRSDPAAGYEPLLDELLRPVLGLCLQHGVRIVSNFGAANPAGAARSIGALASELGLRAPRIAVVHGDDLSGASQRPLLESTIGSEVDALKIVSDYDIVIDGVDNFTAKFLINDACFFAGKPLVHGGILRFDGRVTTIVPKQSACYRCVFKTPPPAGLVASCQEAGVIGVLAGIIGTIQATEALKLILGIGHPLTNRFLDFDARKTQFREIKVKRNPDCALCGAHPTITELFDDGDPFAGCAVRPSLSA